MFSIRKSLFFILLATSSALFADDGSRSVNGVRWVKGRSVSPESLINQNIPASATSLFFIRPEDADTIQTSANIGINNRFQTSIQPNHFSQVFSCSGVNRLSADITGRKHNDLLINAVDYNLAPNQNYFFLVDVDESGRATIQQIDEQMAVNAMNNMTHQNHQISRVVPDCAPAPSAPISIELEVLFDNDKHFVKPQYYPEIERVVQYMNSFPDTVVALEGHTDSNASDEYNIGLSQRRVNEIKNILVRKYGIAANRISTAGYGESRPRADNSTSEGRRLNRRVIATFGTR